MPKIALKEYDAEQGTFMLINGEESIIEMPAVPARGDKISTSVAGRGRIYVVLEVLYGTTAADEIWLFVSEYGSYADLVASAHSASLGAQSALPGTSP